MNGMFIVYTGSCLGRARIADIVQGRACLEPFQLIARHRVPCCDLEWGASIARSDPECDLSIGRSCDNTG